MLAVKVLEAYYPIGARKGKEYSQILVDGEKYARMTFIDHHGDEVEFWDAFGKIYKFNVFQSKIELKA
jgi:hypothetical protein